MFSLPLWGSDFYSGLNIFDISEIVNLDSEIEIEVSLDSAITLETTLDSEITLEPEYISDIWQ